MNIHCKSKIDYRVFFRSRQYCMELLLKNPEGWYTLSITPCSLLKYKNKKFEKARVSKKCSERTKRKYILISPKKIGTSS